MLQRDGGEAGREDLRGTARQVARYQTHCGLAQARVKSRYFVFFTIFETLRCYRPILEVVRQETVHFRFPEHF